MLIFIPEEEKTEFIPNEDYPGIQNQDTNTNELSMNMNDFIKEFGVD